MPPSFLYWFIELNICVLRLARILYFNLQPIFLKEHFFILDDDAIGWVANQDIISILQLNFITFILAFVQPHQFSSFVSGTLKRIDSVVNSKKGGLEN